MGDAAGAEAPRYERGTLTNAQGLAIATHTWACAGEAKGVVVHAHGIDVHCKYELLCAREPGGAHDCYEGSLAQRITEGGCCHVVGLDHQSYGESEGALEGYRSFFWKFDDILADFLQLIERVRADERYQGLPVYLQGCSMGGGVCTRIASERPELIDGMVLVAPLIQMERIKARWPNPILLPLVDAMSVLWPSLAAGSKSSNPFPMLRKEYYGDPLNYTGRVRARVASECLAFIDSLSPRLERVTAPLLVIHSPDDAMTEFSGSEMLIERSASTDKHLERVEGWHVVLHESEGPRMRAFIAEWLRPRVEAAAVARTRRG
jgi:alpha-beta hydrolase superfamily lysophospholipase